MSQSQSVTVIGGVNGSTLTGLVTIPLDLQASVTGASSIPGSLQALLSNISGSVESGTYGLVNVNAVALGLTGSYTVPSGSGVLEFTNTGANGSVSGGSATVNTFYPTSYNTVIVEAPGAETITGLGSANLLAVFGDQTKVRFTPGGGNGTIIAGNAGDFFNLTGGPWSVDGSTDGGDTINSGLGGGIATINTFGQGAAGASNGVTYVPGTSVSNVVGVKSGSATVNSGGTDDLVEVFSGATGVISVSGTPSVNASADILVTGGSATVYAAANSSNVEAFFETGGTLYFVNQTSVEAFVTGDVAGATGGSSTVYGGTGGGVFTGGTGGNNSLYGAFAPGQASTSGGAGLVTLIGGGSSNNLLEATGSVTGNGNAQNVLIAGGTGIVIGGNSTLIATGTTSVNTFEAGNANALVVSTAGAGKQTFDLITGGYVETVTGSTAATATNLFILNESSAAAANTDVITNFSLTATVTGGALKDVISVTGGAAVAAASSITGGAGGTLFTLNDGTQIKLVGVTYNSSYQSYVGKTTI